MTAVPVAQTGALVTMAVEPITTVRGTVWTPMKGSFLRAMFVFAPAAHLRRGVSFGE
jgi:hypothetical protein